MDFIAKQNGKKVKEKSLETATFLYGCFLRVYINFYNKINNPKSIRRVKGIIKIGEPLPGKWVVMSRKSQNIKVVIHAVENMKNVFNMKDVIEVWMKRMGDIIDNSNLNDTEIESLKEIVERIDSKK